MKFLADMNVAMSTVLCLRELGHDAIHLREQGLSRLSDPLILDKARQEGRVILTFDLDFGDLMATGSHPLPSVIIFRLRDATPAFVTYRLKNLIRMKQHELEHGAIVIVENSRYRTRRLPLQEGEDS